VERQKSAAEQTEVDKSHGAGQDEAVSDHLPCRTPGRGDGTTREQGRCTA